MRNAETVRAIHRERGSKQLPLERVYKHLFNPDLYLDGYGKIYRNDGAMTKGSTEETVDGMCLSKVHAIIELLKLERYEWTPVRRTEIPKANGKMRPLGIPTWSDKLLQEVLRDLLEPYYEQKFSDHSHGFRPDRGCHMALREIQRTWKGTTWFIEGDIKGCFDNIDHSILLNIIQRDIHDGRLIKLIDGLLKAGYMQNLQKFDTLCGTPQGGIVSPLLANIYLNELDRFIEDTLVPEYTRGKKRSTSKAYIDAGTQLAKARRHADIHEIKRLRAYMRTLPAGDPCDPNYRRLHFVRYADDFLLGFAGPKKEAEEIRDRIRDFLSDKLKLTLSVEKTLITHVVSDKAHFLGYEITGGMNDSHIISGKRSTNRCITLLMPRKTVDQLRAKYSKNDKVIHKAELLADSDYTIVSRYQNVLRGLYNYYCMATNVSRRMTDIKWALETSLAKTLASKHKCSVREIIQKYKKPGTSPSCLEVILPRPDKKPLFATFGGISFKREPKGLGTVSLQDNATWFNPGGNRSEAVQRLLATKCELCEQDGPLQAHHVRKLADLHKSGQTLKATWQRIMSARSRKTLMVCTKCHTDIHAGRYDGPTTRRNSLESRVR